MLSKLTRSQFDMLQEQFDKLPDMSTSYSSSGEHYRLMHLLNGFGYHPSSREDATDLAERLLSNGYQ